MSNFQHDNRFIDWLDAHRDGVGPRVHWILEWEEARAWKIADVCRDPAILMDIPNIGKVVVRAIKLELEIDGFEISQRALYRSRA